jgi:hypothetical protein
MIFCLVLDNGLKSLKSCESSSTFSLLDMYKTAAESFCKIKPSVSSMENKLILFTTASTTASKIKTSWETPLDQVLEQIKSIRAEGWSDWDETFRQMNEYLVVLRLATGVDTLGQGTFMSTVCNTCIIVFSQGIPQFLGEHWKREKLKLLSPLQPEFIQPAEALTPFLGNSFDRSDFGMHFFVPFCKNISIFDTQVESFKMHLGIVNSRFHIHSFHDQKECMSILEQLPSATSFLTVNLFARREESLDNSRFSKATIIPTDLRHGYWCFPEPTCYQQKLEMHPKLLSPRPSFIGLWVKKSEISDASVQIPAKFPVDEYVVYPDLAEEFIELLEIPHSFLAQNSSIFFDIYSSTCENAKPFGQMKISSSNASEVVVKLTLLPWNFRELFEILASLPSSSSAAFGDRLYRFIVEQVPKNYIDTLKRALKYIGISTKFPKSLDEGYIPECLQARNQLSQIASVHLKMIHQIVSKEKAKPSKKVLSVAQMLSQESLRATGAKSTEFNAKTFLQISSLFFQLAKESPEALAQQEEKVLLPVSKMGNFHKNLAESLKFRNPYQDDHEQSVLNSNLFSSPFKRRKTASELGRNPNPKRARIEFVGVGEDDEFSDVLLVENRSFPDESPLESENVSQNANNLSEIEISSLGTASIGHLMRIIRNPGDSIGKCAEFLLGKSITAPIKEMLCQEAMRWKKHRLIEYIHKR